LILISKLQTTVALKILHFIGESGDGTRLVDLLRWQFFTLLHVSQPPVPDPAPQAFSSLIAGVKAK